MIMEEATKYAKPESWLVKILQALQHCSLNIKLETFELQNFGKKINRKNRIFKHTVVNSLHQTKYQAEGLHL